MSPGPLRSCALLLAATLTVVATGCSDPDASPDATASTAVATTERLVVHRTEVPALHPSVDGYDRELVDIVTSDGTTHRIAVLVASETEERRHGLMEVEALPDGVGMLFVGYDEDRTGGFWMKDTLVPLTIAYLAADGRIVDLVDMEPCAVEECPGYPPDEPYRAALEVRQGWFAEQGIAEGDVVRRAGSR